MLEVKPMLVDEPDSLTGRRRSVNPVDHPLPSLSIKKYLLRGFYQF